MSALSLFHPADPGAHSAVLSRCRTYRYALERRWGSGPFVLFIGLNPSTADESEDDNTIRRCVGYAKDWGMGGLLMGNLFAFRATNPKDMAAADDPVGPDNDTWLPILATRSSLVIAAWGSHPMAVERAETALEWIGKDVHALSLTKDGHPGHPLYLPKTAKPKLYWQTPKNAGRVV